MPARRRSGPTTRPTSADRCTTPPRPLDPRACDRGGLARTDAHGTRGLCLPAARRARSSRDPEVGGYWFAQATPSSRSSCSRLGDLLRHVHAARRDRAARSCRISGRSGRPSSASTLEFSGMRLRQRRIRAGLQSVTWRSGERPLPRNTGAAREPGRRRPGLPEHEEARRRLRRAHRRAAPQHAATASGSADGPTHRTTAPPSATSGRHHSAATGGCASAFATATPYRSGACSSARPQITSRFGQLGRPALEELRLAPLGLEQGHLTLRQRRGERDSGRAAAAADVDDRPGETAYELEPGQRVVEQHAARLGRVAQRRQPGRREDGREPALEDVRRRRGGGR